MLGNIAPVYLQRNDLQPYYYGVVKEYQGGVETEIDLTGAVIYVTMKNAKDGTIKISRDTVGVGIDPDQVANKGKFIYKWQAGATDTTGKYILEFEVVPESGGKFTLPNPRYGTQLVHIRKDNDAT